MQEFAKLSGLKTSAGSNPVASANLLTNYSKIRTRLKKYIDLTKKYNIISFMWKPQISSCSFTFTQPPNTVTGENDYEEITVDVLFQTDEHDGPFFVLKSNGWSIDGKEDISYLINKIMKSIDCKPEIKNNLE